MSESSSDRDPLERLAEEFVLRFRSGERPSLTEYAARLPGREDEVRDLFPALIEMEQLKPVTGDHTGDYTPSAAPGDPTQVGEFRILRRVGVGGMGVVYEAVQESLGRHVALKLLPAEALLDPQRLERFRREAKAAAKLHHTNIVPVFRTGEADGRHYYAMQFIAGHPLDAVIDEVKRLKQPNAPPNSKPVSHVAAALVTNNFHVETTANSDSASVSSLSLSSSGQSFFRSVARLAAQVADGLAYAHGQGILHRDIKPANLLLDLQGTVWVTDFGLAKANDTDNLTHAGDIVGTLRYMAPERFEGHGDHRADLYALGLTLYELLTLTPAFNAANRAKLVEEVLAANPVKPRTLNPAIPRDLETIILKALQREPALRYASASEMADDLRRFLEDRPIQARRASGLEQAWRWCRRNKAVASLLVAMFLVLATGVAASTYFAVQASRKEQDARDAAKSANDERHNVLLEQKRVLEEQAKLQAVQLQTRGLLYASQMRGACEAFNEHRLPRFFELFDEMKPQPGEPDMRGWEWHYLDRLTNSGKMVPLQCPAQPGETRAWVAFSRDGRFGCCACDHDAKRWYEVYELPTGKPTGRIPATGPLQRRDPAAVDDATYLSDGGQLLLLNELHVPRPPDHTSVKHPPRLFEVATGKPLAGPDELVPASSDRLIFNHVSLTNENVAWASMKRLAPEEREPVSGPTRFQELTVTTWDRATGKSQKQVLQDKDGWDSFALNPAGTQVYLSRYSWAATRESVKSGHAVLECRTLDKPQQALWRITRPHDWRRQGAFHVTFSPNKQMALDIDTDRYTVYRLSDGKEHWSFSRSAILTQHLVGEWHNMFVADSGDRCIFQSFGLNTVVEIGPDKQPRTHTVTHRPPVNLHLGDLGHWEATGKTFMKYTNNPCAGVHVIDLTHDPRVIGPGFARRPAVSSNPQMELLTSADGQRKVQYPWPAPSSDPQAPPRTLTIFDAHDRPLGTLRDHTNADVIRFFDGGRRLLLSSAQDPNTRRANGWHYYDIEAVPKQLAQGDGDAMSFPNNDVFFISRDQLAAPTSVADVLAPHRRFRVHDARTGAVLHEHIAKPGQKWLLDRTNLTHDTPPQTTLPLFCLLDQQANAATLHLELRAARTGKVLWLRELPNAAVYDTQKRHVASQGSLPQTLWMADGQKLLVFYFGDQGQMQLTALAAADGRVLYSVAAFMPEDADVLPGQLLRHAIFTPDQRYMALNVGQVLTLIDVTTGATVHRFSGHDGGVLQIFFSADGTRLLALIASHLGRPSLLHVWDRQSGRELLKLPVLDGLLGGQPVWTEQVQPDQFRVRLSSATLLLDGTPR